MDKIKEYIKILKKTYKNPRGKAFLFFGVYFIFFLVLIIMFRVGNSTHKYIDNDTNDNKYTTITWLDNYKYNYKVIIDDKTYDYNGIRIDDVNVINYDGKVYYCDDIECFINGEEVEEDVEPEMIEVDNPCIHNNILKVNNLKKLLKVATKDSTTNYEDGRVAYNYLLATSTIVKNIDKKDVDLDDLPNSIFIVYKDNVQEKLEIDMTSYGKYKNLCSNSFKIIVEFKDQGNNNLNDIE